MIKCLMCAHHHHAWEMCPEPDQMSGGGGAAMPATPIHQSEDKFVSRLDDGKILQQIYLGTKDAISELAINTINDKDWKITVLRKQLEEIEELKGKLDQSEDLIRSLKAKAGNE